MSRIEFFYDVVSPYSYLATHRIEDLAARNHAELVWRPFFLGGVMKQTGNTPPAYLPARAPYLFKDLMRWGKRYGMPIRPPQPFPTNTLTAMRILVQLPQEELPEVSKRLFAAYWGEGRDIGDSAVLTELLGEEAVATAPAGKAALIAASDEAVKRGAFGAPSMFVGDQMFFGNDRLELLELHLQGKL